MMKRLSAWYAECSQRPFGSITIRALPPCSNVSTVTTGVLKSATSSRRSRLRGTDVFMEVDDQLPALLADVDAGVVVGEVDDDAAFAVAAAAEIDVAQRVLLVRRRALRRSAAPAPARPAPRPTVLSDSVTTTALPSTWVSNVCGLFRLNTTRVRLPACTNCRLRNAGSSTARWLLARPLAVSKKSSAMRGGLAIAKPAGGLAGGAFS